MQNLMPIRWLFLAAPLSFGVAPLPGQDWPAWGGPDPGRNMRAPAHALVDSFDPGKPKAGTDDIDPATTRNVKWTAKLGSATYGNPVIAGGKVFVGTNNDPARDKRHQGDRSVLLCLDEKSGRFLWQLVVPKLKAGKANDWENLGLLASPAVVGNRLYVVTSRAEVLCLDTEGMANGNDGPFTDEAHYVVQDTGKPPIEPGPNDADILWRYDMIDELGAFPHNAANGSVLVLNNIVYAPTSNGTDWTHLNVPFPFAPSLIALSAQTGRLLATDDARIGSRLFHGQWSSPSAGILDNRPLVFFGGGDGWLYALHAAPADHQGSNLLNVAWKADANPPDYRAKNGKPVKYGSPDGPSEINATPVFWRDRVFVAIGQDPEQGEGVGRLACFKITPQTTGDVSTSALEWDFRQIHRSLSTVAIDTDANLLFVADFSGFVYCLDPLKGTLHWTHDMKAHIWGSPLVADGRVYIGDEDGDLCTLAVSKEKKILHEANFGGPIYTTPVVANNVLYVATQNCLYALAKTDAK
jgi:outer membrane protein assembly factor BamB